ncbi:MAG: DUF4149 domain-containing protein [Pseudomonadota bacterium]|nr:DUF4149 domain-containing protein [Pseudomonadota bacterium]
MMNVADILTAGLLSIILFFSFSVARNIHRTLDKENAGSLLRVLFPKYFLWSALISFLCLILYIVEGQDIQLIAMSFVFLGSVFSKYYLVPRINKNRDLVMEGNTPSGKSFSSLHLVSVLINIIQMILLILILFLV